MSTRDGRRLWPAWLPRALPAAIVAAILALTVGVASAQEPGADDPAATPAEEGAKKPAEKPAEKPTPKKKSTKKKQDDAKKSKDEDDSADEAEAAEAAKPASLRGLFGESVHAFLTTRYRGRFTHGESDSDLYLTLGADIGDAARHTVTAHLLTRINADLDGDQEVVGYYPFDSLDHSEHGAVSAHLFRAYLAVHGTPYVDVLRVGRQMLDETPDIVIFDGVRADTPDLSEYRIRVGAYGGFPVHLHESSYHNDAGIFGAYVQAAPVSWARLRLDWMNTTADGPVGDPDNLLGAALWLTPLPCIRLEARHTRIDGDARDVQLRANWLKTEWDLRVQVAYSELLRAQVDLPLDLDPFSTFLLALQPYKEFTALASKGFGDYVDLETGADVRWLTHDDSEGTFNREFQRYHVAATLRGWPAEPFEATAGVAAWDGTGRHFWSLYGDVAWQFAKGTRLAIGTDYALYKYDWQLGEERNDVRTYYAEFRWRVLDGLDARVRFTYEDDEFEITKTLDLRVTCRF